MKSLVPIVFLMCSLRLAAQTAKVVQLSPVDVAEVKRLYAEKTEIEKKLADFQIKIEHQYISDEVTYPTTACISGFLVLNPNGTVKSNISSPCNPPKPTPEQEKNSHDWKRKDGWQNGFEYSEDFKFIVPKMTPNSGIYKNSWIDCCAITLTPNIIAN